MEKWGFTYKTILVWHKIRKDGGSDGRGVGFYFRKRDRAGLVRRTRWTPHPPGPGRRQVNLIATCKREHSHKPDELYDIVEGCSPGAYLELFARHRRDGWHAWGDEADAGVIAAGSSADAMAADERTGIYPARPASGAVHPSRESPSCPRGTKATGDSEAALGSHRASADGGGSAPGDSSISRVAACCEAKEQNAWRAWGHQSQN